jgi:regulator of sirC expression with transglutaminase-like and TPR domain
MLTERAELGVLRAALGKPGEAFDIAAAALACSAWNRPNFDVAPYRAHLDELARDVEFHARTAPTAAEALAAALAGNHRYRGDDETYDDLVNADLASVIDRRKGLPVALAILWIHAARRQGWSCVGLNFPSHFLIRLKAPGETMILDPFGAGRAIDAATLHELVRRQLGDDAELVVQQLAPVDDRAVLMRLQNNIRVRLMSAGEHRRALDVVERMLVIAPQDVEIWRQAGLLHGILENLGTAMSCLRQALALAGDETTRQRVAADLARFSARLN